MELTYSLAGDLLERYRRAWLDFEGDAFVDLFTDDVVYHDDPFGEPHVGKLALRAYLLDAAEVQDQLEVEFERHWVVPPTIVAVWHASYVHRRTHNRVRLSGVLVVEIARDGRIERLREWHHRRETPVG